MFANWLLGQCGIEARNAPLGIAMRGPLSMSTTQSGGGAFDVAPVDTRVNGTLFDVPWGRDVEQVIGVAPGERPILLVLSRRDAQISSKRNTAGEPRDDLHFKNATPVAAASLPAHLNADVLWSGGAMLRTAQMAGALESTLDLSTRYATERVQFGKPISSFQAIQHQLAQMAQQTGSAVVSAQAAFAESDDQLAAWQIAAAKVCGAEAVGAAAAMAHAVHGAIGFTHEHALQLGTRRLWAWRSEFGNLSHWAQRLGGAVCRHGAGGLWPAVTSGHLAALSSSPGNTK
jgi:acyl-CoA dehydrogenase